MPADLPDVRQLDAEGLILLWERCGGASPAEESVEIEVVSRMTWAFLNDEEYLELHSSEELCYLRSCVT